MVLISPSILSADFSNLEKEIKKLEKAGADLIHLDVMDGHFVPNFTFGPVIVKCIRPHTDLPFDTHLMVSEPNKMIPWFAEAGADIITIHYEAVDDLRKSLSLIKKHGKKAGVSIKPATKAEVLRPYLDDIDLVLIMSVEPGFGGQKFMTEQLEKIKNIKEMIGKREILIEVDGGIDGDNVSFVKSAGADIIVVGSYIVKSSDYAEKIESLR